MSNTNTPDPTNEVAELSRRIRQVDAARRQEHDPVKRQSLGLELFHLRAEQFRRWKAREREGR